MVIHDVYLQIKFKLVFYSFFFLRAEHQDRVSHVPLAVLELAL